MGPQRLITLFLCLAAVVGALIYSRNRGGQGDPRVLKVCTWSNYFPDSAIAGFEKAHGIRVQLTYISSNEELFAKLKAGATGFDIIQPSDYMVRQMTNLGMLAPIDHGAIPNLTHLDDFYVRLPYDPGLQHSVPFTWGTTGIAVDTSRVKLPTNDVGWDLLFDSPQPRHTSLLDDMREVFAGALFKRGFGANTKEVPALEAARGDIERAKPGILMFSSEPKPLLLRGEISIAHVYSTDAIQAARENPAIRYFIPREGGVMWTDNFAIPSSSRNLRGAHLFIDHFLDPDNAMVILRENLLATPNRSARAKLPPEERDNPAIYPPPDVLKKLQFLEDLGDTAPVMNRMWTELKT